MSSADKGSRRRSGTRERAAQAASKTSVNRACRLGGQWVLLTPAARGWTGWRSAPSGPVSENIVVARDQARANSERRAA